MTLTRTHRQDPATRDGVAQDLAQQRRAARQLVDRGDPLDPCLHAGDVVVAEIAADAGELMRHLDPGGAQHVARPDAGELEKLR